jgi:tetratricopeptide (TPR) repeat protein
VALLEATARPVGAGDAPADFGRDFDVLVQKIESFGGRVEDAGPSRIVAAFGVDPVEDAPRRAALAAIAMRSALTRVPPSDSRRAAAVISQACYTQLRLDPLAPARAEDLLRGLLGDDDALRPLTRLLLERTGGNPFFLEESARSLVETGGLVRELGRSVSAGTSKLSRFRRPSARSWPRASIGCHQTTGSSFRRPRSSARTCRGRSCRQQWRRVVLSENMVVLHPLAAAFAWALAQLGEAIEALDRVRQGEQILARLATSGTVAQSGWAYHALGRACLALGRVDEAQRLAERAVETSPSHLGFRADALHLLGDIATHRDRLDADRGAARYHEALALAGPRGMRPLVAHCHLGLGKLYRRTGRHDQAHERLADATRLYREMDMAFWLDAAEAEAKLSTTSATTTRSRSAPA